MPTYNLRLPKNLYDQIKAEAARHGISMNAWMVVHLHFATAQPHVPERAPSTDSPIAVRREPESADQHRAFAAIAG